jgi:hypothetical protein
MMMYVMNVERMKMTIEITLDMLLDLYLDMKKLYPRTTIDEFIDIISDDGYWDTKTRLSINTETHRWLKKNGGKERLRNLHRQHKLGNLGRKQSLQFKRLKKLLDTSPLSKKELIDEEG